MARKERRAEARAIKKELLALKSDPILTSLMKDKELSDVVKENLIFLEKGEYADSDIQFKYNKVINYIQTVNQLEYRLQKLVEKKEHISNI